MTLIVLVQKWQKKTSVNALLLLDVTAAIVSC